MTAKISDRKSFADLRDRYQNERCILLDLKESFFDDEAFDTLEKLSSELPYEMVDIGDADEPNHVNVGRFMTDVERPELVNRPLSDQAIDIVTQPSFMEAYREIFGGKEYHIRRMQVNAMDEGCFVGYHLDTDSNPDYTAAIILQFGQEFSGGDFVVYDDSREPHPFKPWYRSIMISDCALPHEVAKVTKGRRVSLVYFVSEWSGDNKRVRD